MWFLERRLALLIEEQEKLACYKKLVGYGMMEGA